MLTIEFFGFKAGYHQTKTEIATFFQQKFPRTDVQFIAYDITPENLKGDNTKVIKVIASDRSLMKTIKSRGFLNLSCLTDVHVGLFHYIAIKKADPY